MVGKISLSFVFCIVSFAAVAEGRDSTGVTCERFPDADAVTVDEIERVKYNPDGTYEQTDECWTKILTEKGRRSESSMSLDYSKRYGTAAITYVGAIGTDGTEREIDVSATMKEQTDNSSMSANIYDPLDRVITCTIPGLKVGETLHVKTMRKTVNPRCKDKWADISVMEWSHPIVRSTYEVTAPASRPLRKIAIRNPLGNVVTNVTKLADGSLVHTFTVTNSAQAFPEPDMPPLYTQVQNIRVSTAADWPEISKWYWDLCAPHLAKTNAAMVAKVKELVAAAHKKSNNQTISNQTISQIFKFVSQEVRYMGLTMEDTSPGYAPHDVDVTFDNRYGVCRDKAGLLVAMLQLAGFKAFPVLIHVGAKLDPEVPQPFFNHAIVAVERKAVVGSSSRTKEDSNIHCTTTTSNYDYLLMDPTNENTKDLFPSYLCNNSYLVCRPEGENLATSPVPPPEENALDIESSAALSRDGSMFFEAAIALTGINDTMYRGALARRTPEERVKTFERILKKAVAGAELIRCEISPKDLRDTSVPMSVRLAAKFPEMVIRGETRDELTVPAISKTLGLANWLLEGSTSLEKRKYALKLDTTACVRERLSLDLGGAVGEVMDLPSPERTSGGYDYARTFAVTNGTLAMDRSLTISEVEFSPERYQDLREEIKRVEAAERRKPVFANDRLKDADVRWILNSSETTVFSDKAWITTNTVVKEVLTYAGKKGAAELKFSFNPSVERFGLLSAVVSNKDGRVYSISEREQNLMDCGWASAAPRYPASKLLVVNLPSVEIGSVISYQYVRDVTNAPAAFYAAYGFDSHEPLDRKIVRVDGWRREVVRPRRIPNEPNQPSAVLWRDQVIVSRGDWAKAAERLGKAVDVDPCASLTSGKDSASPLAGAKNGEAESLPLQEVKMIRDWMARYVKIAGPGLYELPVGLQLTDPEVILKERYATRLDYIRTMCALLRGAGCEADVVFAANDAGEPEEVRNRIKYGKPNVRAFNLPLCRVREREGGFLGFGGTVKEYFLGTENQYAPIGPTAYEGCDYFDPASGEFGTVTVPAPEFSDCEEERSEYVIRENGAVDLTVENLTYGSGVGGFRKTYAEILPEVRSRRYQAILGGIAQAASATSELETDTESYPARRKFSCFIPDFATVQGDAITIQIPPLVSSIPSCTGAARQTPFAVAASDVERETVTIRFPEGYTRVESLPKPCVFANPLDPSDVWQAAGVSTKIENGALVVTLTGEVRKRGYSWYGSPFYELIKDWSRIATSRANRTITVRR